MTFDLEKIINRREAFVGGPQFALKQISARKGRIGWNNFTFID